MQCAVECWNPPSFANPGSPLSAWRWRGSPGHCPVHVCPSELDPTPVLLSPHTHHTPLSTHTPHSTDSPHRTRLYDPSDVVLIRRYQPAHSGLETAVVLIWRTPHTHLRARVRQKYVSSAKQLAAESAQSQSTMIGVTRRWTRPKTSAKPSDWEAINPHQSRGNAVHLGWYTPLRRQTCLPHLGASMGTQATLPWASTRPEVAPKWGVGAMAPRLRPRRRRGAVCGLRVKYTSGGEGVVKAALEGSAGHLLPRLILLHFLEESGKKPAETLL